jgi:hypothetical protein
MEQDNKYYTPEVGELRVGYQCEILDDWDNGNNPVYKPHVFKFEHGWIEIPERIVENIRTPYLTREDVESLGWSQNWKETDTYEGCYILTTAPVCEGAPDEIWELWHYDKVVSISNELSNRCYDGECKSINELRLLMRWLQIK